MLGATGPAGAAFVDQALQAGHKVSAIVRDVNKLPENIRQHANLEQGSVGKKAGT